MRAGRRERGLRELYAKDPERADALVFGRRAVPATRRGFLRGAGLAALGAAVGAPVRFAESAPAGWLPVALAQSPAPLPGKDPGLVVLNDLPVNAETPAHLLDDDVTPAARLFVRNNGHPPEAVDPARWTLTIDGESAERSVTLSLDELKRDFPHATLRLQIECGGNGRAEFFPPARGNKWTTGAVGCPSWTGVRLRDVLARAGVRKDAVYVAYHAADTHLSRNPDKEPISRGVPMAKALEDESLLAWAMNGAALPPLHGHPLRLVCGGWPGSVSGKWLRRLAIRDRIHDGAKMTGSSYRVPCRPVAPGEAVPDDEMCIIGSMPVKSLITSPRSGTEHPATRPLALRGHAWAGDLAVASLDVSIDFGQTWQPAHVRPPANRLAWQSWTAEVRFPTPGYYEVWARAVDTLGRGQPMVLPGWNPKGYLNNACHRIAVRAV